jgi:hypothetical protein
MEQEENSRPMCKKGAKYTCGGRKIARREEHEYRIDGIQVEICSLEHSKYSFMSILA